MEHVGRRGLLKMLGAAIGTAEGASAAEARELKPDEVIELRESMRIVLQDMAIFFSELQNVDVRGDIKRPLLRYQHIIEQMTAPGARIDAMLPDSPESTVIAPLFSGEAFYVEPEHFARNIDKAIAKLKSLLLALERAPIPQQTRARSMAFIKALDDLRGKIVAPQSS